MKIPNELVEHFAKGNGAIFVGAGLSKGAGLPDWGDLIQRLAEELDDCPPDTSHLDIAQYYVIQHGKNRLIRRLREELDTLRVAPTSVHNSIIQLGISPLFTTNYDDLLEKALKNAGKDFDLIVNNKDVSFWTADRTQLVKFHGDISQPESVVLTSEDYERFYHDHPALTRLLSITLQTRTLLLLGYSMKDMDFRSLLTQVQSEVGEYARDAYAVMFDAPALIVNDMERRGVKVINFSNVQAKDRNERLTAWLNSLHDEIIRQRQAYKKKREKLPSEPYKFLHWFGEEDIAIFHGREYEINHLKNLVETQRITILYGESGTGKTSLLKAGVIPSLRDKGFLVAYFRPLIDPFREAEISLKSALNLSQEEIISIPEIITDNISNERSLLLVIDQFEEFFIRQGIETREAFERVIKEILDIPDRRIHILISLRSDYLDRLDEFEDMLGHDPLRFRVRLHNLGYASASAAIVEPAKDFGINYDQALLEKLVSDLGQGWIAPPQLQIVCYSLWEDWVARDRPSNGFTLERYAELGSTEEILTNYLTRVIDKLSDEDTLKELSIVLEPDVAKSTAKSILKSLITSEQTKIAVSGKEISRGELILKLEVPTEQINAILRYLQDRRIVRHIPDSQFYELVHEVMIRQIWNWVTEDERRILDIQDILQRALTDFKRFETLLSPEYLSLVSENISDLSFSNDELELLLTSAINYNYFPSVWIEKMRDDHALEVLEKLIATGRKVLYPQIASALGDTNSPKAVRYLDDLCREERRDTQRAAAMAMAKLNIKSVIPPLFHALMREERLHEAAPFLEALERLKVGGAGSMLMLAAMEHKDPGVRKRATKTVLQLNISDGFALLSKQLGSEDIIIQSASIRALETMLDERPKEIIDFFRKSDLDIRAAIVRGLSDIKNTKVLDLLDAAIKDQAVRVRYETVLKLGASNSEQARKLLRDATQDADITIRVLAITMLGKPGNEHIFDTIFIALRKESIKVRMEIAVVLGKLDEDRAKDGLIALLQDPDRKIQRYIVELLTLKKDSRIFMSILSTMSITEAEEFQQLISVLLEFDDVRIFDALTASLNDDRVVEALITALNSNDAKVCQKVASILVKNENRNVINALIANLRNEDVKIRHQVVSILAQLRDAQVIDALIETLNDEDAKIRLQIIPIVSKFDDDRVGVALKEILSNDKSSAVRQTVLTSLRGVESNWAIDILISALRTKSHSQRRQAVAILTASKSAEVIDALIKALGHEAIGVRRLIMSILAGFDDPRVIDVLIEALNDKDASVRRLAINALGQIDDVRVMDALMTIRSRELIDALLEDLNTKGITARMQIIRILKQVGDVRAIDALIEVLNDKDASVRRLAINTLGQIGNAQAVDALTEVLHDKDATMRRLAITALGQIGDARAIDALVEALNDEDVNVGREAISALGEIDDPRTVDVLIATWKSNNSKLSGRVLSTLKKSNNARVADVFIEAVNDKDVNVHGQVLSLLGQSQNPWSVDVLIAALKNEDAKIRRKAIPILAKSKDARAVDVLIEALNNDEDAGVRRKAISAIGQLDDAKAFDVLIEALFNDNNNTQSQVLSLLGQFQSPWSVDVLIAALEHEDVELRRKAIAILAKSNDARVPDVFIAALNDKDPGVQSQILSSLGQFQNPWSVDVLIAALKNKDARIRQQAVSILAKNESDEIVETLIMALRDRDVIVRQQAVFALAKFEDVRVVDALVEALKDEDVEVRWRAVLALIASSKQKDARSIDVTIRASAAERRRKVINSLAQIKGEWVVDILIMALNDDDVRMRRKAALALGEYKDIRVVEALQLALKDSDVIVIQQAIISLGKIGNIGAVDALKTMQNSNLSMVSQLANNAIKKITNTKKSNNF